MGDRCGPVLRVLVSVAGSRPRIIIGWESCGGTYNQILCNYFIRHSVELIIRFKCNVQMKKNGTIKDGERREK